LTAHTGTKNKSMRNIIVVSDLHCGCKFGLCPPSFKLDEGNVNKSSIYQREVYKRWQEFWNIWVPEVTKNEDYIVVVNGDVIDGNHHNSTTQITHNLKDQRNLAVEVLTPVIGKKKCKKLYMIRGTEVHVGKSADDEESVAEALGAVANKDGQFARWELRLIFGSKDQIIHFAHHVGTTSSASYESTAVYKEMVEAYNENGRWEDGQPPSILVRSHRHRQMEIRVANKFGYGIVLCTPGWQLKTPYVYRMAMGRSGSPQIGGYLIRDGNEDGLYTRFRIWQIRQNKPEKPERI